MSPLDLFSSYRHNIIPLVCVRWSNLVKSNELWHDVWVVPKEESNICQSPVSQTKIFRWCNRPHVRPFIRNLNLVGLGSENDDFTAVGLGALFGICCAALKKLELHATRALLSDLTCLLCFHDIEELVLTCVDPDPIHPFHGPDVQCIAGLRGLKKLIFDLNLVLVPGKKPWIEPFFHALFRGTESTAKVRKAWSQWNGKYIVGFVFSIIVAL